MPTLRTRSASASRRSSIGRRRLPRRGPLPSTAVRGPTARLRPRQAAGLLAALLCRGLPSFCSLQYDWPECRRVAGSPASLRPSKLLQPLVARISLSLYLWQVGLAVLWPGPQQAVNAVHLHLPGFPPWQAGQLHL